MVFGFGARRGRLDAWIEHVVIEGRARYGDLDPDFRRLREHLSRIVRRTHSRPATLCAADLFLACCIEQGVDGAWESLLAVHGTPLQSILRSRGTDATTAAEVIDGLPGALMLLGSDPGSTALAGYDGRGSLRSWLAIVALRSISNQRRRSDVEERSVRERPAEADVPSPIDTLKGIEAAATLASSLRQAWRELPARSRLAVALRYVDGASGADVARILGIGQPRVSRIVDAAVKSLRAALETASSEPLKPGLVRDLLAAELAILAAAERPIRDGGDPLATP